MELKLNPLTRSLNSPLKHPQNHLGDWQNFNHHDEPLKLIENQFLLSFQTSWECRKKNLVTKKNVLKLLGHQSPKTSSQSSNR